MKQAVVVLLLGLCAGCSSGKWIDAPRLCKTGALGGFIKTEELAAGWCGNAGMSFTGEYECGEDEKVARVKCK